MSHAAYTLNRVFRPGPRTAFQMDRHYLLYARAGAMRLEYEGRQWSLPPARAALIAADTPIWVSMRHPLTACSVLFDAARTPGPPQRLSVFEMSPLARELVSACRDWGADDVHRPPLAEQLFATLQMVTWGLSTRPFAGVLPVGTSDQVRRALDWTEDHLHDAPVLANAAKAAALSERSLARRFANELGQSWSQVLRQMRMVRAHEELSLTDLPITDVALSVGYQSPSAFNAAFRAAFGTSPSACRAARAGSSDTSDGENRPEFPR